MNFLKREKKRILNQLFLLFLLIPSSLIFVAPNNTAIGINSSILKDLSRKKGVLEQNDGSTDIQNLNPVAFDGNHDEKNKWDEMIQNFDKNNNGINDNFELKLNSLKTIDIAEKSDNSLSLLTKQQIINGINGNKEPENEKISNEKINIIIQFPDGTDYSTASSYFKEIGGQIKSSYKAAINGFTGLIDCDYLNQYCDYLKRNDISFLIEEDSIVNANLYYVSRNMNLRPYTWNTLGYDGDYWSSIAILDTGIDDSHPLFANGYGDQDFTKKIVGWSDQENSIPELEPIDDNGHGSHCAGIAAGDGYPTNGGETNYTTDLSFDYSGYYTYEGYAIITLSKFNVTNPGDVIITCNFTDLTAIDDVDVYAYLYQGGTVKDSYSVTSDDWEHTLSYTALDNDIGEYSLRLRINFVDSNGDGYVDEPAMIFRGLVHFPFDPPKYNSGDPWKGVAPDTHLVGVKVLDYDGSGWDSDIIKGINWVITNAPTYNITVMSLSLGGPAGQSALINAVNNAVENGIVTVVSAGNDGTGGNYIGSPGDADNVITVAAMSNADRVTEYSSQGGPSATGYTIKPDIMAPGGSENEYEVLSADSNDGDLENRYPDGFPNDLYQAEGTSMSAPAVAGAANLLIEAMGGHINWGYSGADAKLVKSLLLMTATETYPLTREGAASYSPLLNRGGKDIHEGYGRINIDAAIEAWTEELTPFGIKSAFLSSSQVNSYNKHALGCYVDLVSGENYRFNLTVPQGADFDLYLYRDISNSYGEPIIVGSSTSSVEGMNETLCFTAPETGKYFLVAKAIKGEGYANISYQPNNIAPNLSNEKFSATLPHNQSKLYNFSVVYSDPDNICPSYVNVSINGTFYFMTKQNPSDNDYTDGCVYQYLTYLEPGNYNYTFGCKDGRFYVSTAEHDDLKVLYSNANIPLLSNGQVNPYYGYNDTTDFEFTIEYTDPDNNKPLWVNITINSTMYTMTKQDLTDNNYIDGCIYVYTTILDDIGTYTYHFNCTDNGINIVNTTAYIGPVVKDSNTLENYRKIPNYIYKWIDATDGIRSQMYNEDNKTEKYYLPFKFHFYNETFNSFYVCTNGFISFENITEGKNVAFPSSSYNYMIAPFWYDFETESPCNIFIKNLTTPDRVVIEWQNFYYYNYYIIGPYLYIQIYLVGSFEIILYESGDILFNYDYLDYCPPYTCGLNFGPNMTYYSSYHSLNSNINNFAILFTVWPNDYIPPSAGEEENNGKESKEEAISLLDFLLSPLGLFIIGTCVALVIIIIVLAKRSSRSGIKEKERIRQLMNESY